VGLVGGWAFGLWCNRLFVGLVFGFAGLGRWLSLGDTKLGGGHMPEPEGGLVTWQGGTC